MKRLFALLLVCVLMTGVITMPASAESAASSVDLYITVNAEGDALVTMQVLLRLETSYESMSFPLPANAKSITLNGQNVTSRQGNDATLVDISRLTRDYVGEAQMRFEYTSPEAVRVDRETVQAALLEKGILGGVRIADDMLLFCVTEQRTKAQIELLIDTVKNL